MKIETAPLAVKSLPGYSEHASLNGVRVLPSGEVVVGTLFGTPALRKIDWREGSAPKVEDLKLEEELGPDVVGVLGSFRLSDRGDLDLVALHEGSFPRWFRKIFGKDFSGKTGVELADFLSTQGSAMGAQTSHLQWKDGKFNVRRFKESGMTHDLQFLGDYVFAMFPGALAREPYLHLQPEKRETLRSDLAGNRALHRSEDGTFWMLTQNGRFSRFQYTENKAKPTPLKFPGFEISPVFALSASSSTDGWLYGVGGDQKILFRLRRNPVSLEEEIQEIWKSEAPITALAVLDRTENSKLLVATEGAEFFAFLLVKPEDEEDLPPVPAVEKLGKAPGISRVSSLTFDSTSGTTWGLEGSFGSSSPRPGKDSCSILRLTEI
ncbi:MAG: hypothetical protein ABIR96_13290 [Bdellovibrionota bacterium]